MYIYTSTILSRLLYVCSNYRIRSYKAIILYTCVLIHYNYSGDGHHITVYNLDANTTVLALRSLTYTYNSMNFPEPVSNTSR